MPPVASGGLMDVTAARGTRFCRGAKELPEIPACAWASSRCLYRRNALYQKCTLVAKRLFGDGQWCGSQPVHPDSIRQNLMLFEDLAPFYSWVEQGD